jgi:hypothetical protein
MLNELSSQKRIICVVVGKDGMVGPWKFSGIPLPHTKGSDVIG